jgi:hypothetical protein
MPVGDIMPFVSAHGGTTTVRYGSMTTGMTFLQGHPVTVVGAGTISGVNENATQQWEIADFTSTADNINAAGIACFSVGADDGDGTTSTVGAPINPKTGVAFAAGDEVAYWPINEGTLFITRNMHDTATTAAVVPAQTDVGESYMLSASQTTAAGLGWGIEQTAGVMGTDVQALVHDVLDAQKAPIRISGNAGVYVVFEIIATTAAA